MAERNGWVSFDEPSDAAVPSVTAAPAGQVASTAAGAQMAQPHPQPRSNAPAEQVHTPFVHMHSAPVSAPPSGQHHAVPHKASSQPHGHDSLFAGAVHAAGRASQAAASAAGQVADAASGAAGRFMLDPFNDLLAGHLPGSGGGGSMQGSTSHERKKPMKPSPHMVRLSQSLQRYNGFYHAQTALPGGKAHVSSGPLTGQQQQIQQQKEQANPQAAAAPVVEASVECIAATAGPFSGGSGGVGAAAAAAGVTAEHIDDLAAMFMPTASQAQESAHSQARSAASHAPCGSVAGTTEPPLFAAMLSSMENAPAAVPQLASEQPPSYASLFGAPPPVAQTATPAVRSGAATEGTLLPPLEPVDSGGFGGLALPPPPPPVGQADFRQQPNPAHGSPAATAANSLQPRQQQSVPHAQAHGRNSGDREALVEQALRSTYNPASRRPADALSLKYSSSLATASSGGGGGDADTELELPPPLPLEELRVGKVSSAADAAAARPDIVMVNIRMPPLRGREPGAKCQLAGGLGSLFLSSGNSKHQNCLMQYIDVGINLKVPDDAPRCINDDVDAAPCCVLEYPDGCDQVVCMAVDDLTGVMWTAHKERRICCWSLAEGASAKPGIAFIANRIGHTNAMAITPWGDLWTGSSSGRMRVLTLSQGASGTARAPVKIRECRLPSGKWPHGKVHSLAASASGRTVWSAGRTGILIWHAYTMDCIGIISGTGGKADVEAAKNSEDAALFVAPEEGLQQSVSDRVPGVPRVVHPRTNLDDMEEAEGNDWSVVGEKVLKSVRMAGKLANRAARLFGDKKQEQREAPIETLPTSGTGAVSLRDHGKIKAIVPTPLVASDTISGMVVVFKQGAIVKYTELGRQLWAMRMPVGVRSVVLAQSRMLWLGCADGSITVLDTDTGNVSARWLAHEYPVIALACVGAIVYSLSPSGALRGWPMTPPPAPFVNSWLALCRSALREQHVRLLAGTWNVNESRPPRECLDKWIGAHCGAADIVLVGLQEVEMGTGSVATDLVANFINKGALERGNVNAQWWYSELHNVLRVRGFVQLGLRQMSGLLVMAFVRDELSPHVGELKTSSVACGVLGVGGNKGAVALSFTVFRRTVLVLNSHFAAHQEKVDERNADYSKITRNLRFGHLKPVLRATPSTVQGSAAPRASMDVAVGGSLPMGALDSATSSTFARPTVHATASGTDLARGPSSGALQREFVAIGEEDEDAVDDAMATAAQARRTSIGGVAPGGDGPGGGGASAVDVADGFEAPPTSEAALGMSDAQLVVWMGDFNYRINGNYEEVVECANKGRFSDLLQNDQLRQEASKGAIFFDLYEVPPSFPPTYKFDKGVACEEGGLLPYDSSEKQRVPAWCDRILWRGSLTVGTPAQHEEDVIVAVRGRSAYHACMDINASDHKPVLLELDVTVPGFVEEERRQHSMVVLAAAAVDAEDAGTARAGRVAEKLQEYVLQHGVIKSPSGDVLSSQHALPPGGSDDLREMLAARGGPLVTISVVVQGQHDLVPLPHFWRPAQHAAQPMAPRLRMRGNRPERVLVRNTGDVDVLVRLASCGTSQRLPAWLEAMPVSFVLAKGESRTVTLTVCAPDIMFTQVGARGACMHPRFLAV